MYYCLQLKNMPEMTEVEKPAAPEAKPAQSESSTDSDSDEDIPELEDAGTANATGTGFTGTAASTGLPVDMVSKAKQSRGEKKARKIMSKLGLKPVRKLHICSVLFQHLKSNFHKSLKIDFIC